jgi:hypothetical protein
MKPVRAREVNRETGVYFRGERTTIGLPNVQAFRVV